VVALWSYHSKMSTVVKRSVSLPSEVFAALEREAEAQGQTVSAALTEAADQWLATRRGLRAVRAWERENGELTADELSAADAELDRAGVARR
jgi:Ribbon-helix-helix protein, copG family